jgi:hypothetical protein
MMTPNIAFEEKISRDFWSWCQGLPGVHLGILLEILCLLDAAASERSVRSRHKARGQYALQGQVTLLEHSINVAMICRGLVSGGVVEGLSIIAGLGHDCGKLTIIHPGRYVAAMHAHWGAEHILWMIKGRLPAVQVEAVVQAVRHHHLAGNGLVHQVLREADGRARQAELEAIVDRMVRGGRGR